MEQIAVSTIVLLALVIFTVIISRRIKNWRAKRQIRREQELRERCVKYTTDGNLVAAASIYRFIVKGTGLERNARTGKVAEYTYLNLEGIIHQDESPTR